MKALLAGTVAVALLAGICTADADPVYSQNAVGYVKVNLEPGQFAILNNVFEQLDPGVDPTPSAVFGDSLPVGTRLYVWNSELQQYNTDRFDVQVGPPPTLIHTTNWVFNTVLLNPGTAFWVHIPSSASSDRDVVMMGEVPTIPDNVTSIIEGFNMIASAYPADVNWLDTELAQNAQVGDRMYLWNVEDQVYNTSVYSIQVGPPPTLIQTTNWTTNPVIPAGAGFWYRSAASKTWAEEKPYSWP